MKFFRFMTSKQKALVAIVVAAILGGGIPVFTKIALVEIPVFSLSFFRFLIAIIFLLPIVIDSVKHLRKNSYNVILVSLLATANTIIFSFGVKQTSATVSQILYATVPLIIILISYLYYKERYNSKQILGIFIGFLGVAIIILLPLFQKGGGVTQNFWGDIIVLIAIVCFSFYSILSKRLHDHYTPFQLTGLFLFTSLVSQLFLGPTDFYTHPYWWHNLTWTGILATVYVGTLGMVVWYILYQYAIKHGTPTIASLIFYIQPIATFGWAFFLLNERLDISFVIGSIITFIGLWITTSTIKSGKLLQNIES